MGIHSINPFLRRKCPEVFETIHLSEFAYKRVAIDTSLYMCAYKAKAGENWLSMFIHLVACLRKNEVHCVFIYDNGCPPEKQKTRAKRAEAREKISQQVFFLEDALEHFELTGEIKPCLSDLHEKASKNSQKRLLSKAPNQMNNIDMELIRTTIASKRRAILEVSPEDYELTRELFDILNVPYLTAPLEAETMCADLCKRGLVEATMTDDTDVLAYGTNVFLSNVSVGEETCTQINYESLINALGMTRHQFLDLCIMCGTDYNDNIKGIGPAYAYRDLMKFGSIEGIIFNTKTDVSVLNHVRGRELFTEYERANISDIPYCGAPDFNRLVDFVKKHNVRIKVDTLKASFVKEIVFQIEE